MLATPGTRVATGTGVPGVRVFGTPFGYSHREAPQHAAQVQRGTRATTKYTGAYVAGQPKGVLVRPNHGRGIGAIPLGKSGTTDPHDSISTIRDPVKRTMMQEVREGRVEGRDRRDYDRDWVRAEMVKRDAAQTDGSRATLAAARGKHGPLRHGATT
eukprot:COSAG05_NODE_10488_length_562_cov_2.006479_2_plen_156_part_01